MKIEIKVGENKYEVSVDQMCYTVSKLQAVVDETSKNYGKETARQINFPTNMEKVVETICKDALASSDEVVTLGEYANRVDAVFASIREQMEAVGV